MARRKIQEFTLEEAMREFLSQERKRLKKGTLSRYEQVMTLFRVFLDHVAPADGAPLRDGDVSVVAGLVEEFRYAFLPHRLHSSESTQSAAATVMRRFVRWLEERTPPDPQPETAEKREAGRSEVQAAVQTHRILTQHLLGQVPTHSARQTTDHFTVTRVETGVLWLEPVTNGGGVIGPVAVPKDVTRLCRVGWDISGVIAKSFGGWRLLEVWSVST